MLSSHHAGTHDVSSRSRLGDGAETALVTRIPELIHDLTNKAHKS